MGACGCDWMGESECVGVAASIDSIRVYVVVCSVCGCLCGYGCHCVGVLI